MIELLTSPEAWAALLTLTALEIVLGIDNVIFLSVIVSRIPRRQATQARQIGLALALVFRILLLTLLVWLIGLTEAIFTVKGMAFSWRDIILIGGGLFLIAKATHEIRGGAPHDQDAGAGISGADRRCAGGRRIQISYPARLHLFCHRVFGCCRSLQCAGQAQPQKRRSLMLFAKTGFHFCGGRAASDNVVRYR